MTDRMKNGECCPYNGYRGLHSPWCSATKTTEGDSELERLRASHQRLKEALQSFVFEFGDKTNSATVNKAREVLRSAP